MLSYYIDLLLLLPGQTRPTVYFCKKYVIEHSQTHSFTYCPWLLPHYYGSIEYLRQNLPGLQSPKCLVSVSL